MEQVSGQASSQSQANFGGEVMNASKKISIREIVLRGDFLAEYIEQFKNAVLISAVMNIKAVDGTSLWVKDDNGDVDTIVNLEN